MIAILPLFAGFARGPLRGFLTAVPRPVWYAVSVAFVTFGLWHWHDHKVSAAYRAGSATQSAADRAAVIAASAAATRAQHDLAQGLAARQSVISQGTADALSAQNADLARRYDDLRLRWATARSAAGHPGKGRATTVSDAAQGLDDAACAARGWVDFDIAAAAARAADEALSRDDAWIDWAERQAAAWPKPES